MNPFESLREYERFVYTLQQRIPHILRSTLVVARRGRLFAELTGEITFPKHHRIPAPGLSFTAPNLLFLINEIETTLV